MSSCVILLPPAVAPCGGAAAAAAARPRAAASCPAAPVVEPEAAPRPSPETDAAPRTEPEWFVLLHDDQEHTYDYVILLLITLCRMSVSEALQHAIEVDTDGVTIVAVRPREEAENLARQIMRFGGDPFLGTACSMKASIEPATG